MNRARLSALAGTRGAVACILLAALSEAASGVALHDGLISYWRLNEGTGSVANDTGPAGSTADAGTLRNGPTWINGKFNAGLQFNGVDQDVLIPASADMDVNTSGVTLSAWVKLDQLPSALAGNFGSIFDSQPDNYVLYLDKGRKELRFKATNSSGVTTTADAHPGIRESLLNTTDWLHVMGVYDGVNGFSKIYYNGQLADVTSNTGNANLLAGTVRAGQVAGIGAQPAATDPFTPGSFFTGGIADVAVWNRPLGLAEAQYLYNGGAGNPVGAENRNINPLPPVAPVKPAAQPVIYYKFNDSLANSGTGGSTYDAVVQGPNPTSYAAAAFGNGLDLSSNPSNGANGIASNTGQGNYLSVDYKLATSGTIATRFTAVELYNWSTVWSNSVGIDDWESWVYADGRFATRAKSGTPNNLAYNIFQLVDPTGSNHFAFTWQKIGEEVLTRLFVNGQFVDERLTAWAEPGDSVFIGGGVSGTAANHYGKGIFDEFRIYETALTEAELLYLSQNAPETVTPTFAADFNADGVVNGADLGLWRTGFGKATGAVRADGDADSDGDVDGSDFLTWQRQRGSGAAAPAAGAAPEPGAGVLAVLATAMAVVARRHVGQRERVAP